MLKSVGTSRVSLMFCLEIRIRIGTNADLKHRF
jgi:hypothetical protein